MRTTRVRSYQRPYDDGDDLKSEEGDEVPARRTRKEPTGGTNNEHAIVATPATPATP
jgi:hypothetical protein